MSHDLLPSSVPPWLQHCELQYCEVMGRLSELSDRQAISFVAQRKIVGLCTSSYIFRKVRGLWERVGDGMCIVLALFLHGSSLAP